MIRLTCANCHATLEVDDAFAGGVCRCQHCKTIQTVPRPGARPNAPGSTGAAANQPKALYQVKSRAGSSSTPSGLEELAEIVQSSGLSGSGLMDGNVRRTRITPPPPTAKGSNRTALLIAAVVGALVAIGVSVAAVMLLQSKPTTPSAQNALPASPIETTGPAFAGTPLSGARIIYLLDRGDATAGYFQGLRDLTIKSVKSLGPDKKFQVVLWDNGSSDAYPALSPAYATAGEVDKLSRWFEGLSIGRSSDVMPALKLAIAQAPDTLILATAKSSQLDESFATDVLAARGAARPVIHTFTLGDSPADDPLKKIAAEANGKFSVLSSNDLNDVARTQ